MELGFLMGDSFWFTWVIVPFLIVLSRVADQSIGTIRLIFVSKGFRYLAPLLGFFEVIIWLVAVGQIIQQLDNVLYYIAYGLGFAAGNYIGIILEERLSLGTVVVRIIPSKDTSKLVEFLKKENFGLTMMEAMGSRGSVTVILTVIPRKTLKSLIEIINRFNPNAFYSIEEVKSVSYGGLVPGSQAMGKSRMPQLWRKSK
ncbi:MAG TPA: DUF2179 domain-containing protein [Bacteroidales bacterium]|nr:DUF2179 domain-containing protein [Bacteroidales bacterium]